MREFHVSMRDLCIRYKGTLSGRNGRFISPIASLHESPRAATRRLDNTRVSSVSPSWVNITPSRASCVYTFRDQSIYIHTYKHQFPMILVSRYTKNILNIYIDISRKISHDPFANNFYIRYRTRNFLNHRFLYSNCPSILPNFMILLIFIKWDQLSKSWRPNMDVIL